MLLLLCYLWLMWRALRAQIILSELLAILDPGKKAYEITAVPDKCHVVMFVGLQGAGKTTTVSKFAMYHKRRGLKT